MLTPDQLKAASTLLQPIFEEYEEFVIKEIVRRLKSAGEWTGSAEMQANLGVSTGVSVNEIILAIKKSLKISDQELAALFEELGATGLLQFNERLTGSGIDPIKIEKFPRLEQITKEAIYQTQGTLHNFTNSMGFSVKTASGMRFMEMAAWYQNALDVAMLKVSTGVQDYNQAIRQIVKEMAQSGLRIVDYSTGYSCGIDVAVRRALLTGLNQMVTEHALEVGNILETDLVEVTAHSGARPSHAVWQGKVYKLHGRTSQYPNLAEATGYGSVSGLKGANCRHSFFPYVEGMPRTYSDEQLMVIDPPPFSYKGKVYTRYEATQKQRAYERRIRALKRELVAYDAAGLEEEFKEASNLLYRTRRYYERFSEVANLRVKNERHQVYEFGREISRKSTAAAGRYSEKLMEKILGKGESDGIIEKDIVTGARNPNGKAANKHAKLYYAAVRKMTTDVEKIAKTTNRSIKEIQEIKNFIFMEEHELDGELKRFAPDYMMAESWRRLMEGKPKPHDITLINHELMEKELMRKGMAQSQAHIETSKKYNYAKEAKEYYDKIKKFKKES